MSESVAAFRAKYRAEEIGPHYSGIAHFLFTTSAAIAIIVVTLWGVHAPTWHQLLAVPIAFLVANAGEYFGHKGPMHHRTPGLGLIFKRHTLQHHHFFTHEAMAYETLRDAKMVLFPWFLILFFFGGMALPIGVGVYFFAGENVARLFVATLVGYFLTYEWLHFAYHLNPQTLVGRLWLVRVLRRHHTTHHDLQLMSRHNFNITFPICDAILGTRWRR
jgi:hypothetical protein